MTVAALARVNGAPQDADGFVSDDCAIITKVVAQIAIRVLFPVASVMMLASVLPITFAAVLLPPVAVGSAFLSAFFFQPENFYCPPAPHAHRPLLADIPSPRIPNLRPAPAAPLPVDAPRGIGNLGCNCWANSDLQLMLSDPFIRAWIRDPLPPPPENMAPFDLENYANFVRTHGEVQRFMEAYDHAAAQGHPVTAGSSQVIRVALRRLTQTISEYPYRQEDPHEGVNNFLNYIPENQKIRFEVLTHRNVAGLPAIEGHPNGIVSAIEAPSWCLQLPITGAAPGIGEMIRAYCDEEVAEPMSTELRSIDGVDRRYPITRFVRRFLEAPPMLRLQLKRFYFQKPPQSLLTRIPWVKDWWQQFAGRIVKNTSPVQIPIHLPLTLADATVHNYRLKSFNCHTGDGPNSGHYTAYSRVGEQWYSENDRSVLPVSAQRIQQALATGEPYMVWYEKEENVAVN